MPTKAKDKDEEPEKKAKPVLNDDGSEAVSDEERQATIDRHQAMLRAKAGMEPDA